MYFQVNIKKKNNFDRKLLKSTSYFWKRLDKEVKISISFQTESSFQYTFRFDNEI